jgi:CHAD domain-containing protein
LELVTLSPEQPYAQAAAEIIGTRAEAVFAFSPKEVRDLGEIEGVHSMRVATRRLRAALEVFGPCFDRKRGRRALAEVKALAAALGERRDRDVQLELLARLGADCKGAERRAIAVLAQELREEQDDANRDLARALGHAKRIGLRRRLARLVR